MAGNENNHPRLNQAQHDALKSLFDSGRLSVSIRIDQPAADSDGDTLKEGTHRAQIVFDSLEGFGRSDVSALGDLLYKLGVSYDNAYHSGNPKPEPPVAEKAVPNATTRIIEDLVYLFDHKWRAILGKSSSTAVNVEYVVAELHRRWDERIVNGFSVYKGKMLTLRGLDKFIIENEILLTESLNRWGYGFTRTAGKPIRYRVFKISETPE